MRALKRLNLENIVFIDIETVSVVEDLTPEHPLWDAWVYKLKRDGKEIDNLTAQREWWKSAALYPEFSKVIVISVGRIKGDKIILKSYTGDEKDILENFVSDLQKVTDHNPKTLLCGQAIIGFDIPFILRRCLVNGVEPHQILDVSDKKPWEVLDTLIDTNVLWKGTGFNGASLIAIATAFGLPSPKDDISGADVGRVYYENAEGALQRIATYCEKDVATVANVVRKCRFEKVLEPVHSTSQDDSDDFEKSPLVVRLFNGAKFGKAEQEALIELYQACPNKQAAMTVLEAMTSTAKGKITNITKAWLKTLK